MKFCVVLVVFLVTISSIEGSRILITAPFGTKSHQNVYVPLTKELLSRGHHVTIITNYANDDLAKLDNVRQIWIEKLVYDTSQFPNLFETIKDPSLKYRMALKAFTVLFTFPGMITEGTYEDPQVKQLMNTESFDLVIFSEACGLICYPFGWHFKAPMIAFSPNVLFPGRAQMLGDDEQLSYVPFLFSSFSDRMSLYQRIINVVSNKFFLFVGYNVHVGNVESIVRRLVNPECPPLLELERNISLVFTNSHPSLNYPRTLPPQVIEIGGLHCRPAKPLPDDLEKFVSSSDAGFLLFGVGSALKMEEMPEKIILSFIKAFSRLPQRVIWQWKGKIRSDLPQNVLAIPWMPQQDLLGHRNCRAFITHGGLNSLQEAIYHGVPVLGMPFGTDQSLNIGRATGAGYAIKLDWKDVTQETLSKAIQDLLHNSSYKLASKKLSVLFRDQLQPPLERAVFWTEFVLRHNGTDHLRLGSIDLPSYQRNLIDVYFVLSLCAIVPLVFIYFFVRKCCFRSSVDLEKKQK